MSYARTSKTILIKLVKTRSILQLTLEKTLPRFEMTKKNEKTGMWIRNVDGQLNFHSVSFLSFFLCDATDGKKRNKNFASSLAFSKRSEVLSFSIKRASCWSKFENQTMSSYGELSVEDHWPHKKNGPLRMGREEMM